MAVDPHVERGQGPRRHPGRDGDAEDGRLTVCKVSLKSGKGSCTLTTKELKAGTYHVTANYPGNGDFSGSASAARTFKVTG